MNTIVADPCSLDFKIIYIKNVSCHSMYEEILEKHDCKEDLEVLYTNLALGTSLMKVRKQDSGAVLVHH